MPDLVHIAAALGGLFILALAGDALVNGAVSLARKMGVSALFVGIVIVGFGTSLPEMIVAVDAAVHGVEGLAFGNIVGSNIANMWLVLGLPALIAPITLSSFGLNRALVATMIATAAWIGITAFMPLTPVIGIAFIGALLLYVTYALVSTRRAMASGVAAEELLDLPSDVMPTGRAIMFAVIGIVGLPIGANLMIDGATGIAHFYGISDRVIGLTLLAVGTSLPEIAAGVAAAVRRQGDVIVGNVVGSNLFNILAAGGAVALLGPFSLSLPGEPSGFLDYDHWFMAASLATIAVGILLRARIGLLLGVLLLLLYAIYVIGLVQNWNVSALFGLQSGV